VRIDGRKGFSARWRVGFNFHRVDARIRGMTAEVKYFLDLGDILAVRLECGECHVRSSFPVTKLTRMRQSCPHCNADWVFPDTAAEKTINAFLASLSRAAEMLQGQPFKLSLEVDYKQAEAPI